MHRRTRRATSASVFDTPQDRRGCVAYSPDSTWKSKTGQGAFSPLSILFLCLSSVPYATLNTDAKQDIVIILHQSNKKQIAGESKIPMARKRSPSKTGSQRPRFKERRKSTESPVTIDSDVLAFLYQHGAPATFNDLMVGSGYAQAGKTDLETAIERLIADNLVRKSGKREYTLCKHAPLYEAVLEQNPRGFGFGAHCTSTVDAPALKRDPFISASRMRLARQGDRILIRVHRTRNDERPEASVIKILARGTERIAGFFVRDKTGGHVVPEDIRFPFTVSVDIGKFPDLRDGEVIIVKIDESDESYRNVRGEILEVLGPADNIDVQMRLVIEKFRLPHVFSEQTEEETAALTAEIAPEHGREDLRDILHVTIDGETAKDFDDAVAVIKTKNGYRLYVSIADVSHFVPTGSAIDHDAYERGTSIYFPGRVIPMLPEKLSNNLCSLMPDQDRLALTAILSFDRQGTLKDKRLVRSIIRSRQRFTYTTVRKILVDQDKETRNTYKPFLTPLKWAGELAKALRQKRRDRGALGFTLPEADIELEEDGRIKAIRRAEHNFAHQVIEEFMLAANEAVAATFTEQQRKSLYRIHELPDPDKVEEFSIFAKTLGLQLPKVENSPHWFARVLDLCSGSPKEYIVNNLLLRTMQQARYSPDNAGHFGLAATDYTHFTSPIRRYPDLMVHREVCRMINLQHDGETSHRKHFALKEAGDYLSTRERIAISAEREITDRLKLIFMEKHIGETFDAVISGVTDTLLFVELLQLFVNGAVAVEDIEGEHFFHDPRHHRLTGELSRKVYQIGNLVRVILIDVDRSRKRISFKLASDKEEIQG
ncbi:ribonuclease R [Desulfoprunum benzoelyticum]|uniref:ribonuclease R n=2 Tax=Desulfoprunum benzoelyticum TaxID=1506996 RepID=UPI00307E821D